MRLGTIRWAEGTSAALVLDDLVAPVRRLPGREATHDVTALIASPLSDAEVEQLSGLTEAADDVVWLPPVPAPPKNVLCVGRNYVEHVKEGARAEGRAQAEIPTVPIWFSKPPTSLVGSGGEIVHDPSFTSTLDFEGELALVIGKPSHGLSRESALDAVFGYTVFNDVTARDVQQRHKQWLRGKGADSYGPCGPWIVTRDEIPDPQDLTITTTVNGTVRQHDTTGNMIFDVATLLADITAGMTLLPGDIIATGTPSGVAWGMDHPEYLAAGDEVAVEITGIGRLWNRVAAAPTAPR